MGESFCGIFGKASTCETCHRGGKSSLKILAVNETQPSADADKGDLLDSPRKTYGFRGFLPVCILCFHIKDCSPPTLPTLSAVVISLSSLLFMVLREGLIALLPSAGEYEDGDELGSAFVKAERKAWNFVVLWLFLLNSCSCFSFGVFEYRCRYA